MKLFVDQFMTSSFDFVFRFDFEPNIIRPNEGRDDPKKTSCPTVVTSNDTQVAYRQHHVTHVPHQCPVVAPLCEFPDSNVVDVSNDEKQDAEQPYPV